MNRQGGRRTGILFALISFALSVLPPAYPQQAPAAEDFSTAGFEIPNFYRVSAALIRGPQPSAEGLKGLKAAGVKTVVNLRNEEILVQREARLARQLGLKFVNMPMEAFEEPSQEDLERFIQIVQNPDNQPVFVHCLYGQDRTGTVVAAYRIAVDGWRASQAYDEMLKFGFRPVLVNLTRAAYACAARQGRAEPMPKLLPGDIKKSLSRGFNNHSNH